MDKIVFYQKNFGGPTHCKRRGKNYTSLGPHRFSFMPLPPMPLQFQMPQPNRPPAQLNPNFRPAGSSSSSTFGGHAAAGASSGRVANGAKAKTVADALKNPAINNQ